MARAAGTHVKGGGRSLVGPASIPEPHSGLEDRGGRQGIPVTPTLQVRCWCDRSYVSVPTAEVRAGRTRSCGRPACTSSA